MTARSLLFMVTLLGASCVGTDTPPSPSVVEQLGHGDATEGGVSSSEPVVGYVRMRDGVHALTRSALLAGPAGYDGREVRAQIWADVDAVPAQSPSATSAIHDPDPVRGYEAR
jgi:hypothetical protein